MPGPRRPPKPKKRQDDTPRERPLEPARRPKRLPKSNPKPKKGLSDEERKIFEGLANDPKLQFLYLQSIEKQQDLEP